jgi:tetratricopeptide (TPR) repeat protein
MRKGQRLLAENDLAEGRAERAVNRLRPLLAFLEGDWPRAFPPPVLAEAYLALGDVARAEELVRRRVQRFRAQNHRRALALWLRVQGTVLRRQQRFEEAHEAFAEAVTLAYAMPYPYAEGRIHYEDGLLHLQFGRPTAARARLERARSLFQRLGAQKDVELTARALDGLR